jgi:ubiquinol-cytochrome c reductase cytochrome b subunit
MDYSPSAQTAWESVYYIQNVMQGGWLLRGIHHFTAQAMIVLLVLHLMQVVIDGAYRAPREVNFWLGLVLMQIVLGLSLTGYLLPWDQKGFWATRVATELMGLVPGVGDDLQRVVVGGPEYGHHTLTRFFALHAGLLPGLLIFFLILHVYMFRRHGLCHKEPLKGPEAMFWPDQLLKDAVACLAVLAVILFLVIRPALSTQGVDLQQGHLGAELGAPADPSEQYSAARPEWYFLFLFQFLKLFPGEYEVVGALVIPGIVMLVLFLMPIIGRWQLGHRFNVVFLLLIIVGAAALTAMAWYDDHYRGDSSKEYLTAVDVAEQDAARAIELAGGPEMIPPTGAVTLLRNDPKTQGRRLFEKHCAVCHGKVLEKSEDKDSPPSGAPDLLGGGLLCEVAAGGRFGTLMWIRGLLVP